MPTTALFPVTVKQKMGFIDAKGRVRIPPQFDFAHPFSEGLAVVGDWDPERKIDPYWRVIKAKCGFINPAGEVVVPPTFDQAQSFKDGWLPFGSARSGGSSTLKARLSLSPSSITRKSSPKGWPSSGSRSRYSFSTRPEPWPLPLRRRALARAATASCAASGSGSGRTWTAPGSRSSN